MKQCKAGVSPQYVVRELFLARVLMHVSTANVITQLVYAFTCVQSSHNALGKFGSAQEARVDLGDRLSSCNSFTFFVLSKLFACIIIGECTLKPVVDHLF